MNVCIIDYGLGNLSSVKNAVLSLGHGVQISNKEGEIDAASHLILPGVGSFHSGMRGLVDNNLVDILNYQVIEKQKKILGICLGMHLFSDVGYENDRCPGLGWIGGEVVKLSNQNGNLRVPHIGWNDIEISNPSILLTNASEDLTFYFVHSYHFVPKDSSMITAFCDYSEKFAAVIEHKNIFATQFHPEKSQSIGQLVLTNFLKKK